MRSDGLQARLALIERGRYGVTAVSGNDVTTRELLLELPRLLGLALLAGLLADVTNE